MYSNFICHVDSNFLLANCSNFICWLDKEPARDPDQSIAANNVVPEVGDGRNDGVDDYVAEPSFSVGKSPPQNGVAAFEKTSGAGGLGEGTPKVSPLFLKYFVLL